MVRASSSIIGVRHSTTNLTTQVVGLLFLMPHPLTWNWDCKRWETTNSKANHPD
jgi:hypothetical protein